MGADSFAAKLADEAKRFELAGSELRRGVNSILRWLVFIATEIYPVVEMNDYPERFATAPDQTDAVRERARAIWRERWLRVEEAIAGTPFVLEERFCVTDIYVAVVSRWAEQDEWRPAHLPKVEGVTAAVATRRRLAEVWERHRG